MTIQILTGDCRDVMRTLPESSVDAIVCDPPYGLGFMGKGWDHQVPGVEFWAAALRVAKPGAHLVAFGGTRTFHRLACAIEDAGWEIRDTLGWLYGTGFPKSLDVSKAIDKARDDRDDVLQVTSTLADLASAAGITRADIDAHMGTSDMGGWWLSTLRHRCACPSVENWTRLRDFIPGAPVLDDLVWRLNGRKGKPGEAWDRREVVGKAYRLDRKEGHVNYGGGTPGGHYDITAPATPAAERWQGWGTALKPGYEPVILARKPLAGTVAANVLAHGTGALNIDGCRVGSEGATTRSHQEPYGDSGRADQGGTQAWRTGHKIETLPLGRWPANLIHDGSDEVIALFPESKGQQGDVRGTEPSRTGDANCYGEYGRVASAKRGDTGSAARFFYCAKASKADRGAGNNHPTVKPTDLMRWLCRLVTPPGGVVLDPFMGSGSTGIAASREGFGFIGIELDPEYAEIARRRIHADAPLLNQEDAA